MVNENTGKLPKIATGGSTWVARRRFNFTKKQLDHLPLPTNGQRAYYYDATTRGLTVAVSTGGRKTFVLYRKVAGRPERITIGPYPDLSIEQARDKADELNGLIARGENPGDTRRKVRSESTLGELFAVFLEQHAKLHKKTWKDDEGLFNNHLSVWRLKKISSIRKVDVTNVHAHIGRTCGKYVANRSIELLCSMFNRACEWGWDGENPAAGIKAFREQKRERFMDGEELKRFFDSLREELNETMHDYFWLCLLTGARRRNVGEMRWSEIDWKRATWEIPATKSKSGESIKVILSPLAVRILESRKITATNDWVFPGRSKTGHLVEPKTAWKRILKRAELTDLRLHDLRRTLGSWQAATGSSLPIIGKSLGHKSLAATQIYARLDLDPVRISVNKATEAMLMAGGVAGLLAEGGGK